MNRLPGYSTFAQTLLLLFVIACGQRERQPRSNSSAEDLEYDYYATTAYLGDMYYFAATQEFYTTAFLLPEYKKIPVSEITAYTDSTIISKTDYARQRLPAALARKYFMLSKMDSVSIFNTQHQLIARGALVRVEYFRNGADAKYIAVYNAGPLDNDPDEVYYCVNRELNELRVDGFNHSHVNNPSLNSYLLHRLNLTTATVQEVTNVSVMPAGITFSVITTATESYLTELKDNQFNILRQMNARYRLERILPLPYEFNGRPLLFAFLYVPGTDEKSVSLGVYTEYTEYRFLNYNRLRLKSIGREVQFGM